MASAIPEEAVGWEWFEQQKRTEAVRAKNEAALDPIDIQRVYAGLFTGQQADIVLADLRRWATTAHQGFNPNLGFYNGAAHGFFTEGVRQMAVYILNQVEAGRLAQKMAKVAAADG